MNDFVLPHEALKSHIIWNDVAMYIFIGIFFVQTYTLQVQIELSDFHVKHFWIFFLICIKWPLSPVEYKPRGAREQQADWTHLLVQDDVAGLIFPHPHKLIYKCQQILPTNTSGSRDI